MNGSSVVSSKLTGHKGSVLCLAHSGSSVLEDSNIKPSSAACLLSGSEDGTARLWDLRSPLRASLCIKAPGDVLSVCFGPCFDGNVAEKSVFARDYSAFLAVDSTVLGYDLRRASTPILSEASVSLESTDEVNQVAFSSRRNPKKTHFLAMGDDSGCLNVTNQFTEEGSKSVVGLSHGSAANPGMVTSLAFRPHCKSLQVATGGTDCRVMLWDASRKKCLSETVISNSDAGANQVCNPPMVHSLMFSPSGRLLTAGLGDGSIGIFGAESNQLVSISRIEDAHGGCVASTVFCEWQEGQVAAKVTANDRLLASAGNDGIVALWDLGDLCPDTVPNPRTLLDGIGRLTLDDDASSGPKTLCAVQHGSKPNWMVASKKDPAFPSTLFLADTSNDITAYTIPIS